MSLNKQDTPEMAYWRRWKEEIRSSSALENTRAQIKTDLKTKFYLCPDLQSTSESISK